MTPSIEDDFELLDVMMRDYEEQPESKKAGPFWALLCESALREIRRFGISDFRGSSSGIGWGFTDNTHYETESLAARQAAIRSDPRLAPLLIRYQVPESTIGGCVNFVEVGGRKIASVYLNLLDQHDHVSELSGYKDARCLFEIGGGFGVNVHLVLENYSNLRKILYLDIPPNLYIGTQYLKAFYGKSVRDYNETRELQRISFLQDDSLEIIAIAPWQLERVEANVDIFHNAHSFVEMPKVVVAAYAEQAKRLLGKNGVVSLLSYDCFDLSTTWDPDELPSFFGGMHFEKRSFPVLDGRYGIIAYVGRVVG